MSTRTALITIRPGEVQPIEMTTPSPQLSQMVVKTICVGLNPTDWKSLDQVTAPGSVIGCDYSGIVEAVGSGVSHLRPGDRVAGFVHGSVYSSPEQGAFATRIVASAALALKIPEAISDEQAATIGVGLTTVGQALYQNLHLPPPSIRENPPSQQKFLLIFGATTATGKLAVQFARLSGLRVIATCSPKRDDDVIALGAEKTFDYKSSNCSEMIREYTGNDLEMVFDCVSQTSTYGASIAAIGSTGGIVVGTLPPKPDLVLSRGDVRLVPVLSYTAEGKAFQKGQHSPEIEARPDNLQFATGWWKLAAEILQGDSIKLNALKVFNGGLAGIPIGLEAGRLGTHTDQKIVYRIA